MYDRALLGMKWEEGVYIDTRLHFGLRSAPIIFLVWCIRDQGVKHIRHYLDDFITVGSPGSMECAANLAVMCAMFSENCIQFEQMVQELWREEFHTKNGKFYLWSILRQLTTSTCK